MGNSMSSKFKCFITGKQFLMQALRVVESLTRIKYKFATLRKLH